MGGGCGSARRDRVGAVGLTLSGRDVAHCGRADLVSYVGVDQPVHAQNGGDGDPELGFGLVGTWTVRCESAGLTHPATTTPADGGHNQDRSDKPGGLDAPEAVMAGPSRRSGGPTSSASAIGGPICVARCRSAWRR